MSPSEPRTPNPEPRKYFLLFAAGFFITFIGIAPIAIYWNIVLITYQEGKSLLELFQPLYVPVAFGYQYRPLSLLMVRILHDYLGYTPLILYVFKGVVMGAFSVATAKLLESLGQKKAWLCVLLFYGCSQALFVTWNIDELEINGSLFLFLGFYAYLRLKGNASFPNYALFLFLSFVCMTLKETTAMYLLVFCFFYLLHLFLRREKPPRRLFVMFAAVIVLAVLFYGVFGYITPQYWTKNRRPITSDHVLFVCWHSLMQLFYPVFTPGAILIFLGGVAAALEKFRAQNEKKILLTGLAGAGLFVFAMTSKLLYYFPFYESAFFPSGSTPFFFCYVLLAGLLLYGIFSREKERLFVFLIFGITATMTLGPMVFPSSREDIGSRALIPAYPFLFALVLSGYFKLRDMLLDAGNAPSRPVRFSLALALTLFTVFISYQTFAGFLNTYSERKAQVYAHYEVKKSLGQFPVENAMVFYTDCINPAREVDVGFVTGKYFKETQYAFLNYHQPQNNVNALLKEIAYKKRNKELLFNQKYKGAYFLVTRPGYENNVMSRFVDEKKFSFYEKGNTYNFLKPFNGSDFWTWHIGTPRWYLKQKYSDETLLETFLRGNAQLLQPYSASYYEIPRWLDDLPFRLFHGISPVQKLKYLGNLYYMKK